MAYILGIQYKHGKPLGVGQLGQQILVAAGGFQTQAAAGRRVFPGFQGGPLVRYNARGRSAKLGDDHGVLGDIDANIKGDARQFSHGSPSMLVDVPPPGSLLLLEKRTKHNHTSLGACRT